MSIEIRSLRNKVAVVGAGMIPFGEHYDKSFEDMLAEAYINCINSVDKGIDPQKEIEAVWYGTVMGPATGATVAEVTGLVGKPITRVENACATGSDAFRNACMAVAAGLYDVVLVISCEKMLDRPGGLIEAIGRAVPHYPWVYAITMPSAFALYATRHMHEFGTKIEHFAMIAVKNHKHGALNPYSHIRREIKVEDVLKSPIVSWPLHLLDCCPITDGAAAVIVCRADLAKKYTDAPVYVQGSGLATNPFLIHLRKSYVTMEPTVEAAKQAYKMAKIEPKDIDFAEVHDCFTPTELISYEDLGFCKKGEGGKFIEEGIPYLGGKLPVNPSGGLKSHGHPIGATGTAQIVEIFWQLRNEAGKRQVEGAEIGLQHNIGGAGPQVSCVHILSNKLF
ncbi:MAG: thiolase domain-containing protein [Candidatus Baldrarchaeia archaeon]